MSQHLMTQYGSVSLAFSLTLFYSAELELAPWVTEWHVDPVIN